MATVLRPVLLIVFALSWMAAATPETARKPLLEVICHDVAALRAKLGHSAYQGYWNRMLEGALAPEWTRLSGSIQDSIGLAPLNALSGTQLLHLTWSEWHGPPSIDADLDPVILQSLWGNLLQRSDAIEREAAGGRALLLGDWRVRKVGQRFSARPFWLPSDSSEDLEEAAPAGSVSLRAGLGNLLPMQPDLGSLELDLHWQPTPGGSRFAGTLSSRPLNLKSITHDGLHRLPRGVLAVLALGVESQPEADWSFLDPILARLQTIGITIPVEAAKGTVDGTVIVMLSYGGYLPAFTVSIADTPGVADLIDEAFGGNVDLERAATRTVTVMLPGPTPLWLRRYEGRWYFSRDQVMLTHLCGRDLLPPSDLLDDDPIPEAAAAALVLDSNALFSLFTSDLPLRLRQLPKSEAKRLQRWQQGLQPLIETMPSAMVAVEPAGDGRWTVHGKDFLLPASLGLLAASWWDHLDAIAFLDERERWLGVLYDSVERFRTSEGNWPKTTDLALLQDQDRPDSLDELLFLTPPDGPMPPARLALTPIAVDDPRIHRGSGSLVLFADGVVGFATGTDIWHMARRQSRLVAGGHYDASGWQPLEARLRRIRDRGVSHSALRLFQSDWPQP